MVNFKERIQMTCDDKNLGWIWTWDFVGALSCQLKNKEVVFDWLLIG